MTNGKLEQSVLDDIIRRVVEVVDPERIILFGVAWRGEMGPHSDVDLLIVKDGSDALNPTAQIHPKLRGVVVPVNAIVASRDDVERYKDSYGLIIRSAIREGRVVYEAA